MALQKSKLHFEQIPVAMVKKIVERAVRNTKDTLNDKAAGVQSAGTKAEPYSMRLPERCREKL